MIIGDPTHSHLAQPVLDTDGFVNDSVWAWENYKAVIAAYLADPNVRTVCEIGGGRSPLFSPAELAQFDVEIFAAAFGVPASLEDLHGQVTGGRRGDDVGDLGLGRKGQHRPAQKDEQGNGRSGQAKDRGLARQSGVTGFLLRLESGGVALVRRQGAVATAGRDR